MTNLTDHTAEGLDLKLIALKDEEINKIYMNQVEYSIAKYQMQASNYQQTRKSRYDYTLNLHRVKFQNPDIVKTSAFLEEEAIKCNQIKEQNREVLDLVIKTVLGNFKGCCNPEYDELQKVKYLLEYVTGTFKYNHNYVNHNVIPFSGDFDFEFSNGVPISDFRDILVTKELTGNELANIIKLLGNWIGLDIEIVSCNHNGKKRFINAILLHKRFKNGTYDIFDYDLSFIDATSVLLGEKEKEDAFLSSKIVLNRNDEYRDFIFLNQDLEEEEHETNNDKYNGKSIVYSDIVIEDIKSIIDNDSSLVKIKYIENDVFKQK